MSKILGSAVLAGALLLAVEAKAQPVDISLPDILAVELPKGATRIGPMISPCANCWLRRVAAIER